ncbi:glycosyl hydrolase [soil metagenome]
MNVLVATQTEVLAVDVDVDRGAMRPATGLAGHRPTCLIADPRAPGRAWCGTDRGGVFRSDDAGATWQPVGLSDLRITAVAAGVTGVAGVADVADAADAAGSAISADAAVAEDPAVIWAGTEPSDVWRSDDFGGSWTRTRRLDDLPSSSEWSFPPRPDTHHVRWIACHPQRAGRLWVAVEAGALVATDDGGRTWQDRVPGGPYDTHELAIHPREPDTLRVSAGDGYYESDDGGATWSRPRDGLEVGYLRSVAIDPGRPDVVLVSASSHAHSAYVAGRSNGRVYRREGGGRWERVRDGWPDPPDTIAPLLIAGGELWAADERGVHRSGDGGSSWRQVAAYPTTPNHLRGIALVGSG